MNLFLLRTPIAFLRIAFIAKHITLIITGDVCIFKTLIYNPLAWLLLNSPKVHVIILIDLTFLIIILSMVIFYFFNLEYLSHIIFFRFCLVQILVTFLVFNRIKCFYHSLQLKFVVILFRVKFS